MKILNGIEIIDLALYLKKHKTLIIADIHIGYEEALNKQGLLVPRFQLKQVIKRLEKILSKAKPETIIINGDVKHEFGKISDQEWRDTLKVLDFLSKHCKKIILTKGNHDTILGPIAKKRNIEIVNSCKIDDLYVIHGHKIPTNIDFTKSKTIIIGHEHPAAGLRKGQRIELFKCFLLGKWKRKNLIVQPSFNLIVEGTDILKEKLLSPFLTKIDNYNVYIVADKIYKFKKVKDLCSLR